MKGGGSAGRISRQRLLAASCVVFLAWFLMKFHMDNSSDSETNAYVSRLLAEVASGSIAADATGHYTSLAPYIVWPPATLLRGLTDVYLIRGLVLALLFVDLLLVATAYLWYRTLGLSVLASLIGLVLLSTSVAFGTQTRGWELDKLIEPALFLLAAIAAWHGKWWMFLALAVLAAANRETGLFLPFVGLLAPAKSPHPIRQRWPVILALVVTGVEVAVLRVLGPTPSVRPFVDLNPDRLVYVLGGSCLLPLLALAWAHATPQTSLRALAYGLTPAWIVFVLATDRIEDGGLLLAPLALLWVPLTVRAVLPVRRAALGPASSVPGT